MSSVELSQHRNFSYESTVTIRTVLRNNGIPLVKVNLFMACETFYSQDDKRYYWRLLQAEYYVTLSSIPDCNFNSILLCVFYYYRL